VRSTSTEKRKRKVPALGLRFDLWSSVFGLRSSVFGLGSVAFEFAYLGLGVT
jgi:hypothetical protein